MPIHMQCQALFPPEKYEKHALKMSSASHDWHLKGSMIFWVKC